MKLKVIVVGKKSRDWQGEGSEDYLSRIRKFAEIEEVFVGAEDEGNIGGEVASKREGKKILSKLDSKDFVVACDPTGKSFSSEKFSELLTTGDDAGKRIVFMIGGSCGLSDEVRNRAETLVSFSKMIFPHELFRIVLYEQIYRGIMMREGRKYHK